MNFLEKFLNNITMYRLVLYFLIVLLVVAGFFGTIGLLPINPVGLTFSTIFLLVVGVLTNFLFSRVLGAATNVESVYISALILALIVTPMHSIKDVGFFFWAAVWTMASKFVVALGKKHIFNPVALAVALTSIAFDRSASWWIGNTPMLPFVFVGGLLIVKKIRRFDMIGSFFFTAILTISGLSLLKGSDVLSSLRVIAVVSPIFFFAGVMLTEPLTTPPTRILQIYYGAIVGFFFAPQVHFGEFYPTPEIALLIGNLFSYIVSPKEKLILKLREKIQISPDVIDFIFTPDRHLSFTPGQYMEWTLSHEGPDERGNRRYFTLASSPTEDDLRIGIKFYPNSSSFKKAMQGMDSSTKIVAAQTSGDFVLASDPNQKLVFIAGGIGITPFRSMIKFLLDTKQQREVILLNSVGTISDIVYKDVFDQAESQLGIKTVYTLTDKNLVPPDWQGKTGHIDQAMIQSVVPDYGQRMFYISGSHSLVSAVEKVLTGLGIRKEMIKTDYFPGFA